MANEAYNAADQVQVEKRKKDVKTREQMSDDGFREAMATVNGRAFIYSLLDFGGIFRTSFDPSNAKTAFNEGQRNFGLKVLADLNRLTPHLYAKMLEENKRS